MWYAGFLGIQHFFKEKTNNNVFIQFFLVGLHAWYIRVIWRSCKVTEVENVSSFGEKQIGNFLNTVS